MSASAATPRFGFSVICTELLRAGVPVRFAAPGHSMHPAIRDGETVHVEPCDPAALRRGEVVLALAPGRPIAHRLLRHLPDGRLLLRGDALAAPDAPIERVDCLGRVVAVERKSRLRRPAAAANRFRAAALRVGAAAWRVAAGVRRALRRSGGVTMWAVRQLALQTHDATIPPSDSTDKAFSSSDQCQLHPSGFHQPPRGDRSRVNEGGAP